MIDVDVLSVRSGRSAVRVGSEGTRERSQESHSISVGSEMEGSLSSPGSWVGESFAGHHHQGRYSDADSEVISLPPSFATHPPPVPPQPSYSPTTSLTSVHSPPDPRLSPTTSFSSQPFHSPSISHPSHSPTTTITSTSPPPPPDYSRYEQTHVRTFHVFEAIKMDEATLQALGGDGE